MKTPFVIRIQSADPSRARSIANRLVPPLRERGVSVRLRGPEGSPVAPADAIVETCARSLPGAAAIIGVRQSLGGPRWLAPLPLDVEPDAAADQVVAFLERWGFTPARRVPAS